MIVLDTNVVSELMRPVPAERVVQWLLAQPPDALHTTSVTQAEILHGLQLLAPGRRRSVMLSAAEEMFEVEFGHKVLPFDGAAAREYARIAAERRRSGRPISQFDAQVAAIAAAARAELATRNVSDFAGCGLRVVDPWEA